MEFKLPDIGEGLAEGEIVKWLVSEGDVVEEGTPLVEVMTDKATVQIPSPCAGTIAKLHAGEGDTVPIETVIVTIDDGKGGAVSAPAAAAASGAAGPAAAVAAAASGGAPSNGVHGATAVAAPPAPAAPVRREGKVLAAPATRKLARERGIDLAIVPGSGPRGRVTRADVQGFQTTAPAPAAATVAAAAPIAPLPVGAEADEERVPLRGLRKRISDAMMRSKQSAAHFSYVDECDMTEVYALRKQWKDMAAESGVKLTFLPFIMKAIVAGLKEFPILNSALDGTTSEIVYRKRFHIGVAADTDDGLVVPVVRDADRRSILDIAGEVMRLAEGARNKTLTSAELSGSTFTITSAGGIGGLFATPILNYPEVAILGVNKIHDRPVVRDGEIVVRKMLYLSMSLDHRVVDGAVAARFLNRVIELLQSPSRLLLEG